MVYSDDLLAEGTDIWDAQKEHPFVVELAEETLDKDAFRHWVEQDYRYLLDYTRVFAIARTKAGDEETMTHLLGVAHEILDFEMDLHREFVDRCGERYPGEHDAMHEAFLTSARLKYQFWEMAYTEEEWTV